MINEDDILMPMTSDWLHIIESFRNDVMNNRFKSDVMHEKEYVFEYDRVEILNQKYKVFQINLLIETLLFGAKYSNILVNECMEKHLMR